MGNVKFLLLVFFLILIMANGCWEEERSALLDLQASIISSNSELLVDWAGYNNSNGFTDCCFWGRVKCSLETGRVIKLNLKSIFGTGDGWRFNGSLFLPFKSLQVLVLSSQNIIGWTKNEGFSKLRQLPNLKEVDLQYNPIHPQVLLSSLCWISSLEVLKLGAYVDTSFTIPTTYNSTSMKSKKCGGGLTNLRELWFRGYGISDINILFELGRLRNLQKLNLNFNNFNSTIFSSLKIFPSLKHLNLAANEINGNIEMNDIIALSNLKHLDLWNNNVESFVTTKGSKRMSYLRNLQFGSLNSNSSRVIQSLKSFSFLKSLSYEDSDLTAPTIIYALRNLSTVEYLYLGGSSVNDNFLPNIGQMTSLKVLSMPSGENNGTLPNQGWCELKHIEEVDFLDNNFEGTLPSCLGNLTSLRWLCLAGNYFRGNIVSHSIWRRLTSLEYLDISHNQFEVPLSFSQFSNYTKLIYLNVGYSTIIPDTEFQNWIPNFQLEFFGIYGYIKLQKLPSFLHYQYDLRILVIDENQLQGKFPTWLLENNTRLAGFYSRDNAFDGPFKLPSIVHLYIETIDVSNNKLNGHIPANMSLAFPKLTYLNMSQNYLEGPIPSKFCGTHLEFLDLSVNKLSGEVPVDLTIGSPQLLYLRLSNNKLKGHMFLEVKSHVLSFLYLNGNNFEGPLPENIFLRPLIVLDASRNSFTGEIPRWITDNKRLLQLDLSNNHLQGLIPVEICNLKFLNVLAISENRLSGFIPSCVSSLPLKHIHLEKNQLGGELGHVLFNFSSLITLDLRRNNFAGNISHAIGSLNNLNYLLLSHNQLEGQIPTQICMLNDLSIIDLSFNMLYGPLPPCLGYLTQTKKDAEISWTYFAENYRGSWLNFVIWMRSKRHYHDSHGLLSDLFLMDVETQVQFSTKRNSYTYKGNILKYMSGIDLSSNRLTGEIPVELGNMSNIHALNLSHNHLNGRIPNTFSNLQEIESLDISCNRLNGSIPVGLIELNYLEVFNVSFNNLSGAVPDFKGQFGTFDKTSYEGNPFLCGYPLDNKCGMSPKLSNTSNINGDEASSELEDIQCFYIGFVVSFGAILLGLAAALCLNRHWRRAWFRMIEALMFYCYYFVLDNIVTPIKSRMLVN